MSRGPRPTPTKILQARGSWRADLRAGEPAPAPANLDPPKWLGKVAAKEWRRVMPELQALGLFTALDLAPLAAYCRAWADWQEAIAMIEEHGATVTTANGYPVQSPWVAIKTTTQKQFLAAAAELGLSPAARTRIKVEATAKPTDGKARFFNAS